MFFKRLSRSRSNSQGQSYVDSYHSPHDSKTNSQTYDDARYAPVSSKDQYGPPPQSAGSDGLNRDLPLDDRRDLPSSRHSNTAPQLGDPLAKETGTSATMYPRQSQPTEVSRNDGIYNSPPTRGMSNGYGDSYDAVPSKTTGSSQAPPDLLMQAFNQALRPHTERVEAMESEIQDLRAYIDQLEAQRGEVHAWIDKRGLRPGKRHLNEIAT